MRHAEKRDIAHTIHAQIIPDQSESPRNNAGQETILEKGVLYSGFASHERFSREFSGGRIGYFQP